jgi:putative nucleotidyltransferase with HDIG domain
MITPDAFAGLRSEVAEVVAAAQKAERDGNRALGRGTYERAIRMLTRDEGEFVPGLIRRIARSYIDDGMFDAALDCLAAAQHLSRARGDTLGIARAFNQMAGANMQRGDLESAEALYNKAQALAEAANDRQLEAMVAQNLGIVAGMRGNLDMALQHYATSLAGYRALHLADYIGPLLNNMAMAHASLGRWKEAENNFTEALSANKLTGDAPSRRMIQVNVVDMLLARGELKRAAELCHTVFSDALAADDQRALGEASKHLGVMARDRGDLKQAERLFEDAHTNAMRREDLLLAAETAREQAELYELAGRNRDTLRALGLSHRLYKKIQAERNLADLAKRVERLENRFYDIVNRWAQTIESKDPYTLGHCERVAEYACALAREIGLEDITMFWFRIGALLHDVGKIEVPTEILTKNGPLTADERAIMERHAAAGADLLRGIEFPWDVLPMIRGHHERWDGAGYPDRLSGESIPLTARVLCIADVFDALASDRPYRPAFARDQAIEIMKRDVGKAFDPSLFDRFLGLISRPGIAAPLMASVRAG